MIRDFGVTVRVWPQRDAALELEQHVRECSECISETMEAITLCAEAERISRRLIKLEVRAAQKRGAQEDVVDD